MLVQTQRCGTIFVEELVPSAPADPRPTLVLWHSILVDGGMWASIPARLAETHRVLVVDGPGHGRSGKVPGAFTLHDCVDAALKVLDTFRVEKAIWMGLSWGGMVGMRLALRAPDRIAGLVLLDTSAQREPFRVLPIYLGMTQLVRFTGITPSLLDRVVPYFLCEETRRNKPEVVAEFRRVMRAMHPDSVVATMEGVVLGRDDITSRLHRIAAPTLVAYGEYDTATPRSCAEAISTRIPKARLAVIPKAGHLPTWEQPDATWNVIEPFIRSI